MDRGIPLQNSEYRSQSQETGVRIIQFLSGEGAKFLSPSEVDVALNEVMRQVRSLYEVNSSDYQQMAEERSKHVALLTRLYPARIALRLQPMTLHRDLPG